MLIRRWQIIRVVGVVLALLGVAGLGDIAWQLVGERGTSVAALYPASYFVRCVGYIVGGVGLVALRKWALPAFLLITAGCRGADLYETWGWETFDGVPMGRIPIAEVVVVFVVVVVVAWGWSMLRWSARH